MVHEFLLRKTQMSTPLISGYSINNCPLPNITPAIADFRYKVPLLPRLRGLKYYTHIIPLCQVSWAFSDFFQKLYSLFFQAIFLLITILVMINKFFYINTSNVSSATSSIISFSAKTGSLGSFFSHSFTSRDNSIISSSSP